MSTPKDPHLTQQRNAIKPLRADAQRNRDALLASARAAFTAGELDIRIEEIARRAGVGVGTLYRHFDTRDALLEAVFKQEVDGMCASAAELFRTLPADEALYTFLRQLVQHALHHPGLADALTAMMVSGSPAFAHGNQQLLETLTTFMAAAVAAGQIRAEVTPQTLLLALGGICGAYGQPEWGQQATAVVELLIHGLHTDPPAHCQATP